MLGLTHVWSTPQHSQGNSVAGRGLESLQGKHNLVLKQNEPAEDNWDAILPIAVLSLNTSYHKSLGYTPYEMRFGPSSCAPMMKEDGMMSNLQVIFSYPLVKVLDKGYLGEIKFV